MWGDAAQVANPRLRDHGGTDGRSLRPGCLLTSATSGRPVPAGRPRSCLPRLGARRCPVRRRASSHRLRGGEADHCARQRISAGLTAAYRRPMHQNDVDLVILVGSDEPHQRPPPCRPRPPASGYKASTSPDPLPPVRGPWPARVTYGNGNVSALITRRGASPARILTGSDDGIRPAGEKHSQDCPRPICR